MTGGYQAANIIEKVDHFHVYLSNNRMASSTDIYTFIDRPSMYFAARKIILPPPPSVRKRGRYASYRVQQESHVSE